MAKQSEAEGGKKSSTSLALLRLAFLAQEK